MNYKFHFDQQCVEVGLTDYALMSTPLLNKGMAFSEQEREIFGLHGLLPPHVASLEDQHLRSYQAFKSKSSDLEKYVYLRDLQDSNETLFYSLLTTHIEEMMPIVYTPTVGEGCQQYSRIYRRPRGVYISYPNRHRIDKILANPRFNETEVIVVSDGERILGLGDQGAGGMGIPIGKLCLYSACAGIHPISTLPILLDTGTDNPERLTDPLYVGWRNKRIREEQYDEFIELFVRAIKKRFPDVLLQWEDFAQRNAGPILEKYRDQLCTFNDDIQGTAAVATGVLLSAINVTGTPLQDQKIVVLGAGSAGCGISNLILRSMVEAGLPEAEARSRFFLIDRSGLLLDEMKDLLAFQKPFAQKKSEISGWKLANANKITLKDVVNHAHPTLLIGVSGQAGAFSEDIVREMAKHVQRPVIFPLSNPTNHSEATPDDLLKWTAGKALIGTGSPFSPILKDGKTFRVDQTNNSYIFPGMGLGLIAVKAKRVTESMFMVAAKALAECSPAKSDPTENLLPPLTQIREVSYKVAVAVAKEAISLGLAQVGSLQEIEAKIRKKMWISKYLSYKKIS